MSYVRNGKQIYLFIVYGAIESLRKSRFTNETLLIIRNFLPRFQEYGFSQREGRIDGSVSLKALLLATVKDNFPPPSLRRSCVLNSQDAKKKQFYNCESVIYREKDMRENYEKYV